MEQRSDAELAVAYLAGEEAALTGLVNRHLKTVYNFVLRQSGEEAVAEDVTQETFIKAWKSLKKFDPKRRFLTWLLAIARNTFLDQLKKKNPVAFSELEREDGSNPVADSLEDSAPLPSELFERKDLAAQVERALSELPAGQREVVHLHYLGQLTFAEIGEISGEPLHTVKSRHFRAMAELRKRLVGSGEIAPPPYLSSKTAGSRPKGGKV